MPRLNALHCYVEGDPAPVAAALGLRPAGETDGALHLLSPYDPGVFYGVLEKAGLKVVSLPQLYADLVGYKPRGVEQAEHLRRAAVGFCGAVRSRICDREGGEASIENKEKTADE